MGKPVCLFRSESQNKSVVVAVHQNEEGEKRCEVAGVARWEVSIPIAATVSELNEAIAMLREARAVMLEGVLIVSKPPRKTTRRLRRKLERQLGHLTCELCGRGLRASDIAAYRAGGAPLGEVPAICEDCAEDAEAVA